MMATYFHGGSEIQAAAGDHNLQTLYLMNPNFIAAYNSEGQTPPNMLFLNPGTALSQGNLPHAPPPPPHQQQQFIGIPLNGPHPSEDGRPSPSSSGSLQHHHHHHHQIPAALHGLSVSRVHPNLWSPANNQSPSQPGPIHTPASGSDMTDHMGFRRPMTAQGLSLSLSPGMQQQQQQNQNPNQNQVTVAGASATSVAASNGVIIGSKYLKAAQELLEEVVTVGSNNKSNSATNNNNNNNNNDVLLHRSGESSGVHKDKAKAAVASDTVRNHSGHGEGLSYGGSNGGGGGGGVGGEISCGGSKNKVAELSTAQRQELQMKKAKLLNMLDEVEQRYRQYNTQMQVVVSSFEQAAGIGSAKSYTNLALKTISKQFKCLKEAIMSQIKATSKSLGEEDSTSNATGVKLEGGAGSRLRFVDHQLRQQRALQQLGMMQHNAWRPQRGLPERAVSVLRAWLFEHFLHPYPKDSDKHMLAKQTGLTRSQVSNWFINARVRLWKPMVEEMYLEEMKTQEQQNSGNSEDNTTNPTTANKTSNTSKNDPSNEKETIVAGQQPDQQQEHGRAILQPHQHQAADHTTNDMISNLSAMSTTSSQGFTLIGSSSDMESLIARSPKKQRSNSDMQNSPSSILSMDMEMKPVDHHHHQQRHSFLMANHGDASNNGFNPYIVNNHDLAGRFNPDQMTAHPYHGNAVSLTLGLPHCENLSLGNHQQNFLPNQANIQLGRRLDLGAGDQGDFCGISMAQPSHPNNGYESIDIQSRKRFAAQLLHDFVA